MIKKTFFLKIAILILLISFTGCDSSGSDAEGANSLTFETAVSIGDRVTVPAGNTSFDMIYASNLESITLPVSSVYDPVDNLGTATLTEKFFMGKTEITNSLFKEVFQWARDNEKIVETFGVHNRVTAGGVSYGMRDLLDLNDIGDLDKISYDEDNDMFLVESGFENYPVVYVSWYGAVMFCNWLTEMRDGAGNTDNLVYEWIDNGDGYLGIASNGEWEHGETDEYPSRSGYRLPSNYEWEYAARYIGTAVPADENLASEYIARSHNSGDASLTPGCCWTPGLYASGALTAAGNNDETKAVAWFVENAAGDIKQPAGRNPNRLGIYDMTGNVWEWCSSEVLAGEHRVLRGTSVSDGTPYSQLGVGFVHHNVPTLEVFSIGFRIARSID